MLGNFESDVESPDILPFETLSLDDDSKFLFNRSRFEDNYVLNKDEQLGDGVNGAVFSCTRRGTSERFAAKFLPECHAARVEARYHTMISKLDATRPFVCKLIDVYINEGQTRDSLDKRKWLILVMELGHGGDLFSFLPGEVGTGCRELKLRPIALKLAQALNELHSVGLTHGDIKPENILLSSDAGDEKTPDILLTDFGFASTSFISSGAPKCTLPYASPELVRAVVSYQLTGNELSMSSKYDGRLADCWALGVTLFLCLCGALPFVETATSKRKLRPGRISNELRSKICGGNLSFDDAEWMLVSDDAKDVVRSLLSVEPHSRMTAKEMLDHPWLKN